jgi:small basic protein (TIGR04137 family)
VAIICYVREWIHVSIDKSLRSRGRLARTRSVLSRDERIKQMKVDDRWTDGQSPFGLPKLRVVRLVVGKKKKKKAEEGADTTADKKADKKAAKK